jgi:hypothetical protein
LWAVFRPSFTPVRSFTVTGISPRALFIPTTIFPSLAGASSTTKDLYTELSKKDMTRDTQAEPLPVRKTKSIGQPQFRSTKSMLPPHSFDMTSAAGTRMAGLFPASWTPNVRSDGCLRTSDHSSFDPARNDVARPTENELRTCLGQDGQDQRTFTTGDVRPVLDAQSTKRLHIGHLEITIKRLG